MVRSYAARIRLRTSSSMSAPISSLYGLMKAWSSLLAAAHSPSNVVSQRAPVKRHGPANA